MQLMHCWSWGALKIVFIYTPLMPCAPAQMKNVNTACVGGASPQKSDCRCSACWSAELLRGGKQGESFASSFLMLCHSSSCPILSLGIRASCTQHSMVCPKEAETARHKKRGFISSFHQDCLKEDAVSLVVLQETFSGFNSANQYIALMKSASLWVPVKKLSPD